MDSKKDPQIMPDDLLKAENAFLKLQLDLEHGMQTEEFSTLKPEVENQWLKSVYAFEQQFKDAGRIKLYDYIGKPPFKKWDTLTIDETRQELDRLLTVMRDNNVQLDYICEYDAATIYRFVTEELFEDEIDDMRIPGMTFHFVYEEFHPNPDYDLRRETIDFLNSLFTKVWNEDYHGISLTKNVIFRGKEHSRNSISLIVAAFQELHGPLKIKTLNISDVTIQPDLVQAHVGATIDVRGKMKNKEHVRYTGVCSINFIRDSEFWQISEFSVPGF